MNTKQIIVHQVNCRGVMGAGFAKYVRQIQQSCFQQYRELCQSHSSKSLLGTLQEYIGEYDIIINLFSQDGYGRVGVFTDYEAMERGLKELRGKYSQETIIAPYKIGCGLAGGDWDVVSSILQKYSIETSQNIILGKKE